MAQTSDEIRQQIAQKREKLGHDLNELETRVRSVADWRAHYRKSPGMLLGLAFGGGLMLSFVGRNHRDSDL